MSALGTYSFLPWLRQGLANQIATADLDGSVKLRASVTVELNLSGDKLDGSAPATATVSKPVALFGPGDIVGIEQRAIVRTEPRNLITNFEPNYLPAIEFYDEDFPWRYTPAAPDLGKHRLRPWIALVVLAESEFTDGKNIANRPLPFVEVTDLNVFSPADQLWAWSHVHVNRSLAANDAEFVSNNMGAVLPKLQATLHENPDLAYSRIVSPRKLDQNTAYHAFLMPVFETGRLAGLGLDPAASPFATFSAWDAYPAGTRAESLSFPYYFRWFFRTATTGDFETLVRLLQPKPVDTRVGRRDMDVVHPGSNLPGITDEALGGILKLGGALRVPREDFTPEELIELDKYENWATPYPRPFQEALAKFVNLTDDYAEQSAPAANAAVGDIAIDPEIDDTDPDPLITAPLYGTWHALTKRLLFERDGSAVSPNDNWVHELNLDPRHRVAAGFGTRVVQDQQEKYMNAAWEQIGKVLEANRRIRLAQLAKEMAWVWHERHLLPLHAANSEKSLFITAPLHKRIMASPFTVHHELTQSLVQPALTSVALRRVIRPRGRLVRALPFGNAVRPTNLIARVNIGEVSAAPPRKIPSGLTTTDEIADALEPGDAPAAVIDALRNNPAWRFAPLIIAALLILLLLLLAPLGLAIVLGIAAVAGGYFLFQRLTAWSNAIAASDSVREEDRTPEAVDKLPASPDFVVSEPGSTFVPRLGGTDSVEAARFKGALKDADALLVASVTAGAVVPKKRLDLSAIGQAVVRGLDPETTIPRRTFAGIILPARVKAEVGEQFVEAMAYPVIDQPMYEPLKNISAELFLPNINLIEQNSITLLETNQKFIEAYMVGLNHEFARELLWREYPTDQRGSYFRQFWDVRSVFNSSNLNDEQLRERLRDIPRLDHWLKSSALGDHDARELAGDKEEEAVLVIRGELLKRYPNTVVYANRAEWQLNPDGSPDKTVERQLVQLLPNEEANPPRDKVRFPLYEAQVAPDIYFFGFDLSIKAAKGETPEQPDDPGWFFVLKERPGEPRFGLDTDKQTDLNVWNDLSWPDVQPGAPGSFIQIDNATPTLTLVSPTLPDEVEKQEQHADDKNLSWNKNMSAADIAYILFQAPVLVGIHAAEMLRKP
jgi:hypothetical protein